jgi:ABC-type sugar transport system permease subunit
VSSIVGAPEPVSAEPLPRGVRRVVARLRREANMSDSDFVVGRNYRRRESLMAYALIAPAFFFFIVFGFYPFARNFYLALLKNGAYPGLPSHYVGPSQLWSTLVSPTFIDSLRSTAIFVAIIVPFGVLGGLTLALMAHQKLRGIAAYRTAFASTVISSIAVAAAVFNIFLSPSNGFLPWLHLNISPPVLSNPTWALPSMALIQVWQFTGVAFIIMMAGLQSLPEEVLEAAIVDGATYWQRLRRVTIPLMAPSIYVTIVVATVGALQGFGQIDVLIGTGSSAFVHTNVLIYLVYQAITVQSNYGLAACYSLILFVITLVVTLLQLRLWQRGTDDVS